jgi:hypothetical protein
MDTSTIALVVTSAFSILASVLGLKYKTGKDKITKLLSDVINAIQDDDVSEEECQRIAADAKSMIQ